jgi:signal transduction histidine kinase
MMIALENLFDNAWKFTRRREVAEIRFFTVDDGGRATFRIADNGSGFDMRYRHKLFAPFQRLHRADEFEGTGIGLVTVARIVRRHGGEVWIEGVEDRGASVSFTLPEAA